MADQRLKFTHLHVHSTYSLLDGLSFRGDLIKKCKEFGMNALAVTDHGSLHQHVSFYQDCQKEGIKSILGCEMYMAPDSHLNRDYDAKNKLEVGDISNAYYHLIVLAKNKKGYQNLMKLSTISHRAGFYYKPRIDFELLSQYHEGLIVTSGCMASIISQSILQGRKDLATDWLNKFRFLFGEDFYLEITNHKMPEDTILAKALTEYGQQLGIPLVLTNDSHYTNKEDALAQEVLLCTTTHKPLSDSTHWRFDGEGYWFKTPEEMAQVVIQNNYPVEAFDNTNAIAAKVQDYDFRLAKKHGHMVPLFKDSTGTTWTIEESHQKLVMACYEGMTKCKAIDPTDGNEKLYIDIPQYVERLQHELDTMERKTFSSYFLIIWDVIEFMKRHGKMLPPFGRGSSVGSLVCRVLGITAMDPIRWHVPFYRFINDGRKDLPDIDTDISQRHRGDVLDYIVKTYGEDHVAHIVTFQTMAAKKAIDDAGAALDIPPPVRKSVSMLLGETDKDDKLAELLENNEEALNMMMTHAMWVEISKKLEGVHRDKSLHAAGVVISNEPIEEHVPLSRDSEGYRVTQWDMKDVQDLGLLKLDMLGLRALDTIWDAVKMVKELKGVEIDIFNLSFDDKATYKTISQGEFVSIFQYDSSGMRNMARSLRPDKFELLMALNALFRPGPMLPQVVTGPDGKQTKAPSIAEIYLDCRHGRKAVETWHPSLNTILADTFGMPLYQEQISEMSKIIAGFTDTEADEYRAAIGKKDAVKFKAAQEKFKGHGMKQGHSEAFMDDLCAKLAGFARYGWNRGHAAGYSYISYVTAYLETHYPIEYYTALLNTNLDKQDRLEVLLGAIMQKGVEIRPPDTNSSGAFFSTNGKTIFMGLLSVKQLASEALLTILYARRAAGGSFGSFIDFVRWTSTNIGTIPTTHPDFITYKLPDWDFKKHPEIPPDYQLKAVNKTVIHNLIKAGAFLWDDTITDKDKINTTENIQKMVKKRPDIEEFQVVGRLDGAITGTEFTMAERSALEREALSFYVSGHPVTSYIKFVNLLHAEGTIVTPSQIKNVNVHAHIIILGLITKKEMKTTKNGKPYVTMYLQDQFGDKSVRVFSPLASEIWPTLIENRIVIVRGVTQPDNFRPDQVDVKVRSVMVVNGGLPIRGFITDQAHMIPTVTSGLGIEPSAIAEVPGYGHVVHFAQTHPISPDQMNKFSHVSNLKLALAI